jgi:hypothetical protein
MLTRKRLRSATVVGHAVLATSLGCKDNQAIGRACDLTVDAGSWQTTVNMSAGECPSGSCLKPGNRGDPIEPPTGATCTAECGSDSDCDGESRDPGDGSDARCQGGFACAVPFVVGPLCCKHLCVCRDFLGPDGASTPLACQGPDALASCRSAAGSAPTSGVAQQIDSYISVSPVGKLDLVFMIDNSASMGPKAGKLNQQLPKMIKTLMDPGDGKYPDLRVAIIDSDLGTAGAYPSGPCGPNDSNGGSGFGDLGNFQMHGAAGCGVNPDALWIEYTRTKPVNFGRTLEISQVFACLASNLGTAGCEAEHQLQAFEFALVAQTLHQGQSGGLQNTFLRPQAFLGLVIVSDEDDCSAASNDGMFGDKPELRGESASLRCATRAHRCNSENLTAAPPGYPAGAAFEAALADCAARTDSCSNATDGISGTDTSGPTTCSPLKNVHRLVEEIKGLKARPDEQIMVAGIFGWPRLGPDGRPDLANAKYKIDLVPNPDTGDADHPQIWDYWPVCYDPDHEPKTPGTYDAEAWGWGARAGLRISAFIDEFGESGLKYSICERDFSAAMKPFGETICRKPAHFCTDAKVMDVDPVTSGLQADCRAVYRVPQGDFSTGPVTYIESQSLPPCPPGATPDTIAEDCWQLVDDPQKCEADGRLINFMRTAAEIDDGPLAEGTKLGIQCWTCAGLTSTPGCNY